MKQVIQDFKTGALFVGDVPIPSISKGYVLVRNHYSLISEDSARVDEPILAFHREHQLFMIIGEHK
jgi:hypothetical protein